MKIPTKPAYEIDHALAGKNVRSAREQRGMSLRKLAIKMGITAPFLSDLERGRRNWNEQRYNSALNILNK